MKELKAPSHKLIKKMNNLILDNQSEDIKLLLFKKGQSIPSLYEEINPLLKHHKVYISQSTFKNMLMDSTTQKYDWEKRLQVINTIFEYLNHSNINAAYEAIKNSRRKKIRRIMKALASDYIDKRDYTPIEILRHVTEDLPEDMKTVWESWKN